MGTTLVILFLATHLYAESIVHSSSATSISTTTTDTLNSSLSSVGMTRTSSQFDEAEELAKIAASCLTHREHEQLSGNLFRYWYARLINHHLIEEAKDIIGLTELRAVLGLAPPGPWTNYRYEEPNADELAAASTIEEYFDLREPRSEDRSLDSSFFFEKSFPPVIAFLDKRFPAIRNIFRRKFETILRLDARGTIDRETIDHMIEEYNVIVSRLNRAISKMYRVRKECMKTSSMLE